jgi:hypothetical protein
MTHTHDAAAVNVQHALLEEVKSLIDNAPWWLLSFGIHLVLLLSAGLIYMDRLVCPEDPGPTAGWAPPREYIRPDGPPDVAGHTPPQKTPDTIGDADFLGGERSVASSDRGPGGQIDGFDDGSGTGLPTLPPDLLIPRGPYRGVEPGAAMVIGPGPGVRRPGSNGDGIFCKRPKRGPGGPGGDGTGPDIGPGGTATAVTLGLRWLARHQSPDGGWRGDGFASECGKVIAGQCGGPGYAEHDVGLTGLALLAFLGAGYTHLSRDVLDGRTAGAVVKNGLQWLAARQDREGCVGDRAGSKYMYGHALAALAFAEAYGMTESQRLREPAQKAIDFLVAAQNPYKGWRYTARCGDNDTSVTGWAVMALKSADLSGLAVPRGAYEGARAWLDEVTAADFDVGYNAKDATGPVVVEGKNENYADHDALVAIAVMSRIFIGTNRSDPRLKGGAERLVRDLPAWDGARIDFYYWYYASLALFQYDGPKGPMWSRWNEHMKNALVLHQQAAKDGCCRGSWEPVDRWGFEGGRVYATAINTLTLEVYYRYANVFGVK